MLKMSLPMSRALNPATLRHSLLQRVPQRALSSTHFPDFNTDGLVQTTSKHGMDVIHDPLLSKGTAFSMDERERLGIRGLVPPRTQEMAKQLLRVKHNLDQCKTPLEKFVFMTALQVRQPAIARSGPERFWGTTPGCEWCLLFTHQCSLLHDLVV